MWTQSLTCLWPFSDWGRLDLKFDVGVKLRFCFELTPFWNVSSGLLIPLPEVKEAKDSPRQRSGSRVFKTSPSPIAITQSVGSSPMTGTSTPESTTPTSKSTRRSFWDILVSLSSLIIYHNAYRNVIAHGFYNWARWELKPPTPASTSAGRKV